MTKDVKNFAHSCIYCLYTATGEVIPWPFDEMLNGSRLNELIHVDYCYIMHGEDELCYVLILKDDLSGYVWLISTEITNAATTADALKRWFSLFGFVPNWVSNKASHFKNELMKTLRKASRGNHHFKPAYSPWANGTVERVSSELLRSLHALLFDFQLPLRCWPSVLPIAQSILNKPSLSRMERRCTLIVFTGLPQDSPLLLIKQKFGNHGRYKVSRRCAPVR